MSSRFVTVYTVKQSMATEILKLSWQPKAKNSQNCWYFKSNPKPWLHSEWIFRLFLRSHHQQEQVVSRREQKESGSISEEASAFIIQAALNVTASRSEAGVVTRQYVILNSNSYFYSFFLRRMCHVQEVNSLTSGS